MTWSNLHTALAVERVKKIWCIYTYDTVKHYSGVKKNEVMSLAATWRDLEIVIPSEETQRNIVWYGSYMESKKK